MAHYALPLPFKTTFETLRRVCCLLLLLLLLVCCVLCCMFPHIYIYLQSTGGVGCGILILAYCGSSGFVVWCAPKTHSCRLPKKQSGAQHLRKPQRTTPKMARPIKASEKHCPYVCPGRQSMPITRQASIVDSLVLDPKRAHSRDW